MKFLGLALCVLAQSGSVDAPTRRAAPALHETVLPVAREKLPNARGMELVAVEVLFPPGSSALPHRHPSGAFLYAYVLSGEILSALGDEGPRLYRAGDSWHEDPGAVHRVARNPDRQRPARLLAIFIAPEGESDLVRPIVGAR